MLQMQTYTAQKYCHKYKYKSHSSATNANIHPKNSFTNAHIHPKNSFSNANIHPKISFTNANIHSKIVFKLPTCTTETTIKCKQTSQE